MTTLRFTIALAYAFTALSLGMAVGWLAWAKTRKSGWIDTTWALALGLTSITGAFFIGPISPRVALISILVCLWSSRLGLHITQRTTTSADDPRYERLITDWGERASTQMFWFAQKQGWVSIPLAVSIMIAAWNPAQGFRFQDYLGAVLLVAAIGGEALADWQLKRFRSNPVNKGRVCDQGLWRLSRHPNYFFEWVCWLAYPIVAVDLQGEYPWGWLAISGPLVMYVLLVHVSGIPLLERHMLTRSGDEFRRYQARTNAFFPGPPRNGI